jgi:hypothetical protein
MELKEIGQDSYVMKQLPKRAIKDGTILDQRTEVNFNLLKPRGYFTYHQL